MISAALAQAQGALQDALAEPGVVWRLREEVEADRGFVDALYSAIRREELAPVPWPEAVKREFLQQQSRLQAEHYRRNYPGALLGVIERDDVPVGRLYLHASLDEFRVMDIALLPQFRGAGQGGRMILALQDVAAAQSRRITLHVESNNPVQRLYARLGFTLIEDRGVYHFLGWSPAQLNTAS